VSFDLLHPDDMVREQELARNPLSPASANALPPQLAQKEPKAPTTHSTVMPQRTTSHQPEFGRPSALGASSPSHSQPPYSVPPAANKTAQRQGGGSAGDKYSNLFISSKNTSQRPELHNPHLRANPLQQARERTVGATPSMQQDPSAQTSTGQLDDGDDDVFEISNPGLFSTRQPQPIHRPLFSSQTSTNPYFQSNMVDLTMQKTGYAINSDLFHGDHGATTDPYTHVDVAKANENIKALLEGAFEDEEDRPRTRRERKQQVEKIEDLADKLEKTNVKDTPVEEEEDDDDGTVEGLKVTLLPHQIEGVTWMRDKELGTKKTRGVLPKGGILADDMGLGKTIQSIALILTNPKPSAQDIEKSKRKLPDDLGKGTLVVAPLALIRQWEGEIKDRVDEKFALNVCVHHGPQRAKSYKELKKYDVVITTYQTLSSEHAGCTDTLKVGCFGIHWYRVILDEAHSIKNRNAKATKAACALNAEYRWCLTGTPMQNNLDELQSLIHFLRIRPYDDLNIWREQITRPMNNGRGGLAVKRLQVYLKAFMKRRTKDVLKQQGALNEGAADDRARGQKPKTAFQIVQRTVEKVEVDFTPEERQFYVRLESRTDRSLKQMMAGNGMSYASALVLLMRLRQACNHPRLTGSDLGNERDAFSGGQTPSGRGRGAASDDIDSIADMLGGLTVQTKRCDMCQAELSAREASGGAIRCPECEADLAAQSGAQQKKKKERKRHGQAERATRKHHNRRLITDSDDEDDGRHEEDDTEGEEEDEDEDDDSSNSHSSTSNLLTSTKIRHLLSILSADAHRHKYIVFSFFTSMLDLIEPFLRARGIRFVRYDGQMRNDMREASLNKLRSDPKTRVLLCSLRAGSLGLNLTAASRVVLLEPFWNPFVEEQAIDRVHRLNQTQDVVVYKLTIRDTVEARILELQEKKRELANATIEGRKGAMKLTLQDMLRLFRHDAEREHGVDLGGVGMGTTDRKGLLARPDGGVDGRSG